MKQFLSKLQDLKQETVIKTQTSYLSKKYEYEVIHVSDFTRL